MLNNKGFAISTVLYSLLIMATLVLFLLIGNFQFERNSTSDFVNNIVNELNNYADNHVSNSPAVPSMDSNMIAVRYEANNWIKTNANDGWYDYDNGIWANAVTVSSSTRATYQTAAIGTVIDMNDIETMWVWIPRYSYTIGSEDGTNYYGKKGTFLDKNPTQALPGEIDIRFVDTNVKDRGDGRYKVSEGINSTDWYTPDAFTFGTNELSGIWVAKFESATDNEECNTKDNTASCNSNLDLIVKPNVVSWRNISVANMHAASIKVASSGNRYGFSTKTSSHMMKNSEWGAVAYLSQSRYGKLGNVNYSNADKEIYHNKSEKFITGCSYGAPPNSKLDYGCQYTYNIEKLGTGASTTGTIYGIYDMSGGAWEYVMANYENKLGNSGFTALPDSNYYNLYTGSDLSKACGGSECLSHGLTETLHWYNDYTNVPTASAPWILRGAIKGDGIWAGIFGFSPASLYGAPGYNDTFRVVLNVI